MARSTASIWFAASMFCAGVATASAAQEPCAPPPPPTPERGIIIDICVGHGCHGPDEIILDVTGDESSAIAEVVARDLERAGMLVIDPSHPRAGVADALVWLSTSPQDDGSIGVDLEVLKLCGDALAEAPQ